MVSFSRRFANFPSGWIWRTRRNMCRRCSTLIARGLRRIQQIVKDLRDFARLDESDLHEVDLNAGIQSTVNIILGKAKKRRVEINLELGKLPLITCYPAKINQVVMNLVSNAIDASPEGGHVTVKTASEDGRIRGLEVMDQEKGVPTEIRGRIFDPFLTTKPIGEGTGVRIKHQLRDQCAIMGERLTWSMPGGWGEV